MYGRNRVTGILDDMSKRIGIVVVVVSIVVVAAFAVTIGLILGQRKDLPPESSQVTVSETSQEPTSTIEEVNAAQQPVQGADLARFIDLNQFNSAQSSYADFRKVYFFHAEWCSICKGIERSMAENPSVIPENTVMIKVDFDSERTLRERYGVTTQYTFVQIDTNGDEVKQWTATSAERAVAQIQ